MNWLHTWAGVVTGGLLFAIFWMGTLSVFDREIDLWMMPMTRLQAGGPFTSADVIRPAIAEAAAARSAFLSAIFPTERQPAIRVHWSGEAGPVLRYLDPATGAALPDPGTLAGTGFLYPFHYMLHIRAGRLGAWIVGFAGMAMLVLCVSGVVIHRKIFADFFTFRAARMPRRLILDLHNVTGVVGLPFHFIITLSGLVIFFATYFPGTVQLTYGGDRRAFVRDSLDSFSRPRLDRAGAIASLDSMVSDARRAWTAAGSVIVFVNHPGDAASYVEVSRPREDHVNVLGDAAYFDAATGRLLHRRSDIKPVLAAERFILGLHVIQFRHWTLRWAYFGLGLVGCVLIATGFLFWLESRRRKHEQQASRGVPLVEGLTVGSVTGIVIATLAFFVANRLMPLGVTFAGYDRAALEVWTFYLSWLATFAHAWLRPRAAWREQCVVISALALFAVMLNWITTGDHLVRSLGNSHLWPIAGMDILLLVAAALAMLASIRLRRAASTP